jgi:hypothetical protein
MVIWVGMVSWNPHHLVYSICVSNCIMGGLKTVLIRLVQSKTKKATLGEGITPLPVTL